MIVAIRPNEFTSDSLFITIAHEGRHIADAWTNVYGDEKEKVTKRETEYTAYVVSVLTAIGGRYQNTVNVNGNAIYRKGWTRVDGKALETALGSLGCGLSGRGPNGQVGSLKASWSMTRNDGGRAWY